MKEIWSFFSGAGGLDLGFEIAGLSPTLAVELDSTCCQTLRHNRPSLQVLEESVSNLNAQKLHAARRSKGDVFLMVGGPPCQSFSPGGTRAGLSDPRGNLIYEYLRLIGDVRPRYFVLENVANLVTAALRHRPIEERPGKNWSLKSYDRQQFGAGDGAKPLQPDEMSGSAIKQLLRDLRGLNYHVTFSVLDAADYGAPQHRLRFVMLGARDAKPPVSPRPTHGEGKELLPFATVRDAIHDLRMNPGDHSEYTPEVREFFELVPPGGTWRDLPPALQRKALGGAYDSGGGKTGFYRRLNWDMPAPTITGRSNRKGSAVCHPEFTRPVSVWESARLQGFPDSWYFVGSMSQQYLQIGNAVPVPLGAAIGRQFKAIPLGRKTKSPIVDEDPVALLNSAVQRLRASARNKRSRADTQVSLFDQA